MSNKAHIARELIIVMVKGHTPDKILTKYKT